MINRVAAVPGLMLVAPAGADAAVASARLEAAFSGVTAGHGIDAVLIGAGLSEAQTLAAAGQQVALVQGHGAAAIIVNHSRVAGRLDADGVHVETGLADIRSAVHTFRPDRIVGAGNLPSRHAAMEAGSEDIDYVLFGRLRGDTRPEAHPGAVALAQWWADVMTLPVVLAAGNSLTTLDQLPGNVDFVALDRAIWDYPGGPAAAVRKARTILSGFPEHAA